MITKIQSFTDVITNSSSTVFVMHEDDANYYNRLENTYDCVYIEPITKDWLINNPHEVEMVCDVLEVDPKEITTYNEGYYGWGYWETPNQDDWITFLDIYKDKISEAFKDLYWVDIEDHFEDAYEVTENALGDCVWHDNRH